MPEESQRTDAGLRLIAFVEFAKGALVVLVGIGLLRALGPGAEEVATSLVRHLNLNPAKGIPHVFILAAEHTSNRRLVSLAVLALLYSTLRFVEGYGLWRERAWAEWLAVGSGAIYMPYEIAELIRAVTPLRVATLLVNVAVVGYLAWRLRSRGTPRRVTTAAR